MYYQTVKHRKTKHLTIIEGFHIPERYNTDDYTIRYTYHQTEAPIFYGKHCTAPSAEKMNKFWKGAKGHERVGRLDASGIPASGVFNGIRLVLKQLHNHACMQGDAKLITKLRSSDSWFYDKSSYYGKPNVKTLLLSEGD